MIAKVQVEVRGEVDQNRGQDNAYEPSYSSESETRFGAGQIILAWIGGVVEDYDLMANFECAAALIFVNDELTIHCVAETNLKKKLLS